MTIRYDPDETPLRVVLEQLGYTTKDVPRANKQIIDNGTVLSTGNAYEVWEWLQETGRACPMGRPS